MSESNSPAQFDASAIFSGCLRPGEKVIVGYSGGADSTCLLHLLAEWGQVEIVAAHLHHGMRPEADEEAEKCRAWAEELGVEFAYGKADTPKLARDFRIGIEEAGRKARYEFFHRARHHFGASRILTAHTLDDHAETVLLNIARGTGLRGLRGIPVQTESVVRPMLGIRRSETRAYCQFNKLWFHDDPTNFDLSIPRVIVREQVLPGLKELNPEVLEAVRRLAEIAAEEDDYLNSVAAAALEQIEVEPNRLLSFLTQDAEVILDRRGWLTVPQALQRRMIRLVASVLGAELDRDSTLSLQSQLQKCDKGSWTVAESLVRCEWAEEKLHFFKHEPRTDFRHHLACPGVTTDEYLGWKIEVRDVTEMSDIQLRPSLIAHWDASKVKQPVHFRNAQTGDRFEPFGAPGTKLVSDCFQEMGWTHLLRNRLPIVCDMVGILWVPGYDIAERVRVSEATTRIWKLELGPIRPNGETRK